MATEDHKKKVYRRRWIQFRLRTLLALAVLTCFGAAAWVNYRKPYVLQEEACKELVAVGAQLNLELPGPIWLRNLAGKRLPGEIITIHLDGRASVEDKHLTCLSDLRSLRGLYLGGTGVTDETLRRISRLKNVQRVSLWRTSISDEGLQYLGNLPSLQVLDLHHTDIGDQGMEYLSQSRSLAWLNISYNQRISGQGLSHLAEIPSLRELRFNGVSVSSDEIQQLAGSRIERLNLSPYPTDSVDHLTGLKNLRILPYLNQSITPELLQKLQSLTQLEELQVGVEALGPDGTVHLLPFQNLRKLSLFGGWKWRVPVTAADMARLASLPKLESLDLHDANLDDQALSPIESMVGLRSLNLRKTKVTDAGLASIAKLKNLEELDLGKLKITDAGLAHLSGLTKLRLLSCDSELITDAGLDHLEGMSNIQGLDLCGTKLTMEAAEAFHAKHPNCRIEDNWCCGCMTIMPVQ